MQTDHVIAQCRWQGGFDRQAQAPALQDFLSRWSNTVLRDELERCFSERCPATQTWRIDTLRLDLGDIALDDLPLELPRRLRAGLNAALDGMLAGQQPAAADGGKGQLRILDRSDVLEDFFSWFLQHGSLPWWFQDGRGALQMVDQLFAERGAAAAAIVRDLGRDEAVRRRLAWQLGEARLRRLVRLLEPWHGDVVCAYADKLFAVQSRHRLPAVDPGEFRHHAWLAILSYLLVERGTLFNTIAFVRAGIWRAAQQYRVDPRALLQRMALAVRALRPLGAVSADFLVAIETIHRDEQADLPAAVPAAPDYWPIWQAMLREGAAQRTIAQDRVGYAELFAALAQQDAGRMAQALRREGTAAAVRQAMLRHLPVRELARVAQVLAPQDHLFIVAYCEHTEQLAELRRQDKHSVWQVLLAYLLLPRGSHFNRRQLVNDTLRQLCEAHGYQFAELLDLLIHSVTVEHPHQHRFELLTILRELEDEQAKNGPLPAPRHRPGGAPDDDAMSRPAQARRLFSALLAGGVPALMRAPQLAGLDDVPLGRRLLGLAGAADLPLLLDALQPGAAAVCLPLYRRLLDGQRRGELSSLDRLDLAFQLPAMLIQALPAVAGRRRAVPERFEPAAYWRRLCALLARQGGVDSALLERQLQAGAGHASAAGGAAAPPQPAWRESRQLPPGLPRPHELLRQWAGLLRDSGCWQGADALLDRQLAAVYQAVAAAPRASGLGAATLLARMITAACLRLDLDLAQVLAGYREQLPALPHGLWHDSYAVLTGQAEPRLIGDDGGRTRRPGAGFRQDHLGRYLDDPRLPAIARHLLAHGSPPSWLPRRAAVDLPRLLHDLFHVRPDYLPALLAQLGRRPAALVRLMHLVPFNWLAAALRALFPSRQPEITLLEQLHRSLQTTAIPGTGRRQREALLFRLVLRHGLAGDWAALAPEQLAGRLAWQLMRAHPLGVAALRRALAPQLGLLPERWRRALNTVTLELPVPAPVPARTVRQPARPAARNARAIPMRINNAGLVLLQSYIQPLLSRLGLVRDGGFVSEAARRRAVHYLQFLVTGQRLTPEPYLVLNKLLCGLAPHDPVELSIEITVEEEEMCEELLKAVIGYWPEAGSTSVDGFRGNWLVRDGSLTDAGDHWDLIADRRAYDVLLARLPLSYSVIKLPWMEKAIYVTWPT
jgi:hypothetical protein